MEAAIKRILKQLCALLAAAGIVMGCAGERAFSPSGGEDVTRSGPAVAVDISVTGAQAMINERRGDEGFYIIDVRTPEEYASGHIEGAVNLDYNNGKFAAALDKLDKNGAYLLICRSGGRSAGARDLMAGAGFFKIYNMLGGMNQWAADGNPVITE